MPSASSSSASASSPSCSPSPCDASSNTSASGPTGGGWASRSKASCAATACSWRRRWLRAVVTPPGRASARAPPFERDPGVPAEGVPPRRHCRAPTRPRTSALYAALRPLLDARARRARANTCPHVLPRAMTPTSSPQCSSPFLRRALGGGEAPLCAQIGANPPTHPRQFHCSGTEELLGRLPTRRPVVPASSLTCDFNMIKNYTHDWLFSSLLHASFLPPRRSVCSLGAVSGSARCRDPRDRNLPTSPCSPSVLPPQPHHRGSPSSAAAAS
jgi:hypothetical protein